MLVSKSGNLFPVTIFHHGIIMESSWNHHGIITNNVIDTHSLFFKIKNTQQTQNVDHN
jgi:hypothetical protein